MKKAINKKLYKGAMIAALSASIICGSLAVTNSAILTIAEEGAVPVASNYTINNTIEGKTYYVGPDAARGSGDGSETNPYNIYDLLTGDKLAPGDTVIVKNGEYEVNSAMKVAANGSPQGYITVKKEDAAGDAVLKFYEMPFLSTNRGVEIIGDYWHWVDVDICGAGDNGMYIGGSYNVVENSRFYDNRDTGLQLGRSYSEYNNINDWPSYNLIKNCTSFNNYDNETYGENADGFAAKLTVGYGNIFDGCIAYRNSDDGWDLYAKADSGNIGAVIMYNCVAFENGFLMESQAEFNAKFPNYQTSFNEPDTTSYYTRDGDGNGFKLGGSVMDGDVFLYNSMSFNNRMHGVTDNSNPGVLNIKNVTSYNNAATVNGSGDIVMSGVSTDSCNNIDMSRQSYSYNIFSNVLSVNKDSATLGTDAYRGAAEYSYFGSSAGKAYAVEGWADVSDASEAYAVKGTQKDAISADVFETLPISWTKGQDGTISDYVYTLTGKDNTTVHETYRNADGSINMGNILKIKDSAYAGMFGDDHKIGATLTGTSWDAYTHADYVNASACTSAEEAAVVSAHATLQPITATEATFQDFDLNAVMENVSISWSSSDTSVIAIDDDTTASYSGARDARAIVYRGAEDKTVTLTATITSTTDKSISKKKAFEITVKADVPTIGDVVVKGIDGNSMIVDQFSDVTEPEFDVLNAADYNGKVLDKSAYKVKSVYMYASDKTANPVEIHHFTTGVSGVYTISKTISLNNKSVSFSYTIYVASSFADVKFAGTPSITVNKDGYIISGEVSSPTGKLYAYSTTEADADITAEEVVAKGTAYEFRNDAISAQFSNANSGAYHVYYVLTNLYGEVTSEVYSTAVETVEIDTAAKLKEVLLKNDSSKIYMLTADIDFAADLSWVPEAVASGLGEGDSVPGNVWKDEVSGKKVPFKGLLNGNGHTIKNLTVASDTNETAAVIYKLAGGTVENIKFENITITGKSQKAGLIAISEGGYLYNIAMKNISVAGAQRVGALIGQVALNDTYIDQVSLTNDRTYTKAEGVTEADFAKMTYYVLAEGVYSKANAYAVGTEYYTLDADITGDRIGGIVGFIQSSSASNYSKTYISNVYVNAVFGTSTSQYIGSVVGRYDDRNSQDYLEITTAYSNSVLRGNKYQGGIIGGQSGAGVLRISKAMFNGNLYYAGDLSTELFAALKNCSGIMGYYSANADTEIGQCFARFIEYNSDYDVDTDALVLGNAKQIRFWEDNMGITDERWTLILTQDGTRVQDPYVTLKFLEN